MKCDKTENPAWSIKGRINENNKVPEKERGIEIKDTDVSFQKK